MEKPADRTKQVGPAGDPCRSYPSQLASIRFTYEHERWALMMASTASTMAVRLCTCSCPWACVSVGHAQSQVCGRRRASANIHSTRQAAGRQAGSMSPIAMRQRVRGLHATPHNTPLVKSHTDHATCLNVTPTNAQPFPPAPPHPNVPQNPLSQYKQPCIRAKRVSSIQLDWSYWSTASFHFSFFC